MRRIFIVFAVLAIGTVPAFSFVVGYSTPPGLDEVRIAANYSPYEIDIMAAPLLLGGVYMMDRFADGQFAWYFDLTYANHPYFASVDGERYDLRFFYTRQEINYFIAGNRAYFVGLGLQQIVMQQVYPEVSSRDFYVTHVGFPVLTTGVNVTRSQFNFGMKYTQRLNFNLENTALGPGEVTLQLGISL